MNELPPKPVIVAFVSDLFFASRIQTAAEKLGYEVNWIEDADSFGEEIDQGTTRLLGEHMEGIGAVVLELLTRILPALLIFDLSNPKVPWKEWLALIKSVPATRRLPVICFGSHVDTQTLAEAKSRGAEIVVARSRFVDALPEMIKNYARIPDLQVIEDACQEPLSVAALNGLEQFNHGEYFDAHESLEEAWNQDRGVGRELYRAILQIAVAYLQIQRGNYRGAIKMFLRVRQWIMPLPAVCRGVNVDKLRQDSEQVYKDLLLAGPDRIHQFDRLVFKPVEYAIE